jgi:chemotaxis protein CheD
MVLATPRVGAATPPSSAVPRVGGQTGSVLVAGIGEMVVTRDPSVMLIAYGLGSCVALTLWDPQTKTAALAHFMLPSGPLNSPPVKFVDSGLPTLLAEFQRAGGQPRRAQLKAAGGAAMLAVVATTMEIGKRNAEALQIALGQNGLRLHQQDLGGKSGRTVQLEPATGRLLIKSVSSVSVL